MSINPLSIANVSGATSASDTGTPAKSKGANVAHDFEALLVSQMLHGMRESGSGWFGTGDDQSMDSVLGLAEEQLSQALTAGKGFGLSKLVEQGLKTK